MNTGELFRKMVYDKNARRVGRVADVIFDLPPGVITHIVVRAGLFKRYTINLGKVSKVGDSLILGVSADELGKG